MKKFYIMVLAFVIVGLCGCTISRSKSDDMMKNLSGNSALQNSIVLTDNSISLLNKNEVLTQEKVKLFADVSDKDRYWKNEIGCKAIRVHNGMIYTAYRVDDETIFIVKLSDTKMLKANILEWTNVTNGLKREMFDQLIIGQSTLEDVQTIDPNLMLLYPSIVPLASEHFLITGETIHISYNLARVVTEISTLSTGGFLKDVLDIDKC